MLLWEPPSDSLVHTTNLSTPVCESSHSPRKRALTSALIVVFLAIIAAANIPGDPVKAVDDPALSAVGARQVWSVFAPDPTQVVAYVSVHFTYRDGSSSTWRIRKGNPLLHAYRDYRWLKLAENAAHSQTAATNLLIWAARTEAEHKPIARADLVREVYDIAAPGKPQSQHGPVERGVLVSVKADD
jgi:hypothetical protein